VAVIVVEKRGYQVIPAEKPKNIKHKGKKPQADEEEELPSDILHKRNRLIVHCGKCATGKSRPIFSNDIQSFPVLAQAWVIL
jgi:hypothetical protein